MYYISFNNNLKRISNNQQFTSYASITKQSENYYNQNQDTIIWLTNSTCFGPIFLSYLGVMIVEINLELALILGNVFNFIGFLLRYVGQNDINYAISGQIIGSISQIFYQTGSISISQTYFQNKEEFFIINIQQQANFIGTALGFYISQYIVANNYKYVQYLNKISLQFSLIPMIMVLLLIFEIKKINQITCNQKIELKRCFNYLLYNNEYQVMILMFSFGVANCWSYISIISNYLSQANLNSNQIGIIAMIYTLSGSLMGLITSCLLSKYQAYYQIYFDFFIKILMVTMFFSTLYFSFYFQHLDFFHHLVLNAIMGGSGISLISFISVAIIENTYPYSESITTNGLFFLGNLISLFTTVISLIPGRIYEFTYSISIIPSLIYILFYYKTKFKKTNFINT